MVYLLSKLWDCALWGCGAECLHVITALKLFKESMKWKLASEKTAGRTFDPELLGNAVSGGVREVCFGCRVKRPLTPSSDLQ